MKAIPLPVRERIIHLYAQGKSTAGSTIQEIEGLEFKALGEPANADLKLDGK
jgi:hypothetical protein